MADVLISIVNHDNETMLLKCLESLSDACGHVAWEVTITDNVPSAYSSEEVGRVCPRAKILRNSCPRGFGENHNEVLRETIETEGARYVLILNDDTVLGSGSIEILIDRLNRDPNLGAVAPRILDSDGEELSSRLAYPSVRGAVAYDLHGRNYPADNEGWLQGCCLLVRVAALKTVGVFDERFFLFYEDVDLSRRLTNAGWELAMVPDALITHHSHATILREPYAEFPWRQGMRSRYLYFSKYRGHVIALLLAWFSRSSCLAGCLVGYARFTCSGRPEQRSSAVFRLNLARYNPRRPVRSGPSG